MKNLLAAVSILALVGCAHHDNDDNSVTASGGTGSYSGAQAGQSTASTTAGNLTAADSRFVKEAAQGGLMEVKMGQMAVQNGESQAVKDFGQKLIQDHSKANQELTQIATKKGISLPTEADTKNSKHMEHLSSLKGAEFDKAFRKHAVEDHQKDIKKFEAAAQNAQDAELKAFAAKTLPVLQQHLTMAKELAGAASTSTEAGVSSQGATGTGTTIQPGQNNSTDPSPNPTQGEGAKDLSGNDKTPGEQQQ